MLGVLVSGLKRALWIPVGILALVLVAVVQVLCAPFFLYRWLLSGAARLCRPSLGRMLSPIGAMHANSGQDTHVTMNFTVEGGGVSQVIKETIQKQFLYKKAPNGDLAYPELQQAPVLWLGYKFWKGLPDFNPDLHIRVISNEGGMSRTEFNRYEVGWSRAPFPPKRSPWEILIFENVEGETVLAFKFHHALADGQAIFDSFIGIVDDYVPNYVPAVGIPFWLNFWLKVRPILNVGPELGRLLRLVVSGNPPCWKSCRTMGGADDVWNYAAIGAVSTSVLKEISSSQKVSFSAVLLAGLSGGIEKTCLKYGQPAPKRLRTQVYLPEPKRSTRLTNDFHVTALDLNLYAKTAQERLRRSVQSIQSTGSSDFLFSFGEFISLRLPSCFQRVSEGASLPSALPLILSNFPGPRLGVSLVGRRVLNMNYYLTAKINPSIFFQVHSYNGQLSLAVTGDKRIFPKEEYLAELIDSVLEEFKEMVRLSRQQAWV